MIPGREQEFMDWGLGMFVHWSFDSQLGSVISHSMDYASRDYLNRYVNELPKTFNPMQYNPDKWMEIAKLAGVKYMPTNEEYKSGSRLINMLIETRAKGGNLLINMGPMPSGIVPLKQEERFRELALWMFVNDEAIHDIRPCVTAGSLESAYYTQSKDGKYV